MSIRLSNENLTFRNIDDEYENEISGSRNIIQRLRRFSTKSSVKSSQNADSSTDDAPTNNNTNNSSKKKFLIKIKLLINMISIASTFGRSNAFI